MCGVYRYETRTMGRTEKDKIEDFEMWAGYKRQRNRHGAVKDHRVRDQSGIWKLLIGKEPWYDDIIT